MMGRCLNDWIRRSACHGFYFYDYIPIARWSVDVMIMWGKLSSIQPETTILTLALVWIVWFLDCFIQCTFCYFRHSDHCEVHPPGALPRAIPRCSHVCQAPKPFQRGAEVTLWALPQIHHWALMITSVHTAFYLLLLSTIKLIWLNTNPAGFRSMPYFGAAYPVSPGLNLS